MAIQKTQIKQYDLENGLGVLIYNMPSANSVTVQLWVKAGSRFESKENSGISHFLEHALFEGSESYPSNHELRKAIENMTGDFGAYTAKEEVSYWVKILGKNGEKAVDFLYELTFRALLDKKPVEKEKEIIIQEIQRKKDNPESYRWDFLLKSVWTEENPMGRITPGTEKTINSMTAKMLRDYLERFYVPNNMLLVAAGQLDTQSILKRIKNTFGNLPGDVQALTPSQVNIGALADRKQRVFIEPRYHSKQINLTLAFISEVSYRHKDNMSLSILGQVLNNKIFDTLVYGLGLSYSAFASRWMFSDHSLLNIMAGVAPNKLPIVLGKIIETVNKLKIDSESVEEAKKSFKKNLLLNLADTDKLAEFMGEQKFFEGRVKTPDEIEKEIDIVKLSDLKRLKKQVLKRKNAVLAVLGAKTNQRNALEKILQKLS